MIFQVNNTDLGRQVGRMENPDRELPLTMQAATHDVEAPPSSWWDRNKNYVYIGGAAVGFWLALRWLRR